MKKADIKNLKTPCYVLDKRLLIKNLEILDRVQKEAGCKILMALKGFSAFSLFRTAGEYLAGITASSLFEARLGYEEMGKEVHVFAPAYREDEFDELMGYAEHIVFNSFEQVDRFREKLNSNPKEIEIGVRINPEYSEVDVPLYDPCAPNSRLGTTAAHFDFSRVGELDGLHFHALCEQNASTLENVVVAVKKNFGSVLSQVKWVNFGGGHHITRPDYDVDLLINIIKDFKAEYGVEVYLEPGEAIILNAGYLVVSVLDIQPNIVDNAILDTSAACHMPDVLEMPYRPEIIGAGQPGEFSHTYRLGGLTCLAGDVIGDYSFKEPLKVGDKLIFCDMGHYTMVKNNTFNGVNLPSIAILDDQGIRVIREFHYQDYKGRLS
ncbi:MAG: carboxynorspermidine decarboxylase [Eubacteriales bacterium]